MQANVLRDGAPQVSEVLFLSHKFIELYCPERPQRTSPLMPPLFLAPRPMHLVDMANQSRYSSKMGLEEVSESFSRWPNPLTENCTQCETQLSSEIPSPHSADGEWPWERATSQGSKAHDGQSRDHNALNLLHCPLLYGTHLRNVGLAPYYLNLKCALLQFGFLKIHNPQNLWNSLLSTIFD